MCEISASSESFIAQKITENGLWTASDLTLELPGYSVAHQSNPEDVEFTFLSQSHSKWFSVSEPLWSPPFKKKKNSYSLWQELACSPSEFWPTVPGRAEDGSKTIFVIASHNLLFFSVLHAYPLYGCGCRVTYSSTPNSALPLISETESDHVVSTLVPSYASHSPLWAFWVPGGLLVNLSPLISKWICRRISWSAKAESKGC